MLIKDSSADRRFLSDFFLLSTSFADLTSSAGRTEQQAQSPCLAHYCLSFPEEWKQNNIITFSSSHTFTSESKYFCSELFLRCFFFKVLLQENFTCCWCPGNQRSEDNLFLVFFFLTLFCFALPSHPTFTGDKLERVAEYSETWDSFFRAIINKLMAQPISTLSTKDLQISTIYTTVAIK